MTRVFDLTELWSREKWTQKQHSRRSDAVSHSQGRVGDLRPASGQSAENMVRQSHGVWHSVRVGNATDPKRHFGWFVQLKMESMKEVHRDADGQEARGRPGQQQSCQQRDLIMQPSFLR